MSHKPKWKHRSQGPKAGRRVHVMRKPKHALEPEPTIRPLRVKIASLCNVEKP